ncbi:PQ-loop domain-containing transporter [Nocardia jejuensis]|uniref:PQ-loop domain-containing transporter n=1 Tax=Nocardia jejuensis TaxID=328049 RepID=UPI000AE501EC|nr:PQ-loop domain-containing transporter [Nocardia jejuensis]
MVAGAVATAVFASSTLPMLVKAVRTKDVSSYSPSNIALANIGNIIYMVYVLHLPPGPIWALHLFHTLSSALMLIWYLRYVVLARRSEAEIH